MPLPIPKPPPPRLGKTAWKAKNPKGIYQNYTKAYNRKFGTTAGLKPYTGYTGPGVQDLINSGQMSGQGLGNLGYTPNPTAWQNTQQGAARPTPIQTPTADEVPNYNELIANSWQVREAEQEATGRRGAAEENLRNLIRRAVIDYGYEGGDTSQFGEAAKYLDPETLAAAQANQYSTLSQTATAERRGLAQSEAALAARGMLSSGQSTKSSGDITTQAGQARYEGLRGAQDVFGQGFAQRAQTETDIGDLIRQARGNAAQWVADTYIPPAPIGQPGSVAGVGPSAGRPGWQMTPSGKGRMSRETFLAQKPQGNYQNYLNYLRQHRGGRL